MTRTLRRTLRAATLGAALTAGMAPAAALNLPFGLGGGKERAATARESPAEAPTRMAQIGDSGQRLSQLEEENRRLNGKLEEISFQILQMQEQMRKMQEDNEFRFQEIEGGAKPAAAGAPGGKRTEAAPEGGAARPTATAALPGQAPGRDEIGSLLGEDGLEPGAGATEGAASSASPPATSSTVAAIRTGNAGELYGLAYNYLLAGDYQLAETSFRQYAQTYPDAKDVPDARYWMGESQFQQAKYADAAETFLNAQKQHPKSSKAPEMMLKLGMSLAKLDNRDTACVTFREVGKRYPQMSATVKRKLQTETQAAKCGA